MDWMSKRDGCVLLYAATRQIICVHVLTYTVLMPRRPPSPCPDCGVLVVGGGRCDRHRAAIQRALDERRGSAHERGYNSRWRKYREGYLRSHPLCVQCERDGLVVAATVVDHIVPHRGDTTRFWDRANHQALCKGCHDHKTATQDGGFGRPPASDG